MPRAFATACNSGSVSTGTSPKTILQYTAPSNGAVIRGIRATADGVSSATAKVPIDIIRGATGGTGSSVTPGARGSNNPSVGSLGSSKENFTVEPSGGTVIHTDFMAPYGQYDAPLVQEIVLAGGETIAFRTSASAAVNVRVNFDPIEV